MKRSNLNFWIDAIAFALFVFLVATGVLMEFLLPAGSGHSTTIWGLDRHQWGSVHFWISVGFLTAMALHVYLHWKWVVSVVRGRPREGSGARAGLGILGLVALLAIAAAPLVTPVERGNTRNVAEPRWGLSTESELIQGSMTLGDVMEVTGVTLEFLVRELGLPQNVSVDDRLGRIARDNGLSVAEIREVVEQGISVGNDHPIALQRPEIEEPALVEAPEPQQPPAAPAPRSEEQHAEHDDHEESMAGLADIRGAMTLAEIVALGVPREVLYRELRIPAGIPIDERLGRLGRTYGFSMTQVRELVETHR
jgi:hypothetical protein